jgi:hypothetical protein
MQTMMGNRIRVPLTMDSTELPLFNENGKQVEIIPVKNGNQILILSQEALKENGFP